MPTEARRDPPLPPLDFPALVTIHDLPDPSKAQVEVTHHKTKGPGYMMRRLVEGPARIGREGCER